MGSSTSRTIHDCEDVRLRNPTTICISSYTAANEVHYQFIAQQPTVADFRSSTDRMIMSQKANGETPNKR